MRRIPGASLAILAGLLLLTPIVRGQAASQVSGTLTSGAGTCGAGNAGGSGCLVLPMLGFSAVTVQVSGTWCCQIAVEGSVNGLEPFQAVALLPWGTTPSMPQAVFSANGIYTGSFPGFVYLRFTMDAPNGGNYQSGAAAVTARAVTVGYDVPMAPAPTQIRTLPAAGLPLPLCNPVARFFCSPKGF